MRVDTAEQAIKDVDWYADHGYAQIKIYSSVKPELVPIMADRAQMIGGRSHVERGGKGGVEIVCLVPQTALSPALS